MNKITEIDLIKSCQQGDRKGQELLYARFANRMYRIGFRYLKSEMDAEDVVVMAFGKIFKKISDFNYLGTGSLEAWMRKIVVNEALMALRKQHNFSVTESIDDQISEISLQPVSEAAAEDIYKMITQLPTGCRTVFNLVVVEGYSHQEVSELLTISEGTSRSQLFKAKAWLKKMLIREGFHYGT